LTSGPLLAELCRNSWKQNLDSVSFHVPAFSMYGWERISEDTKHLKVSNVSCPGCLLATLAVVTEITWKSCFYDFYHLFASHFSPGKQMTWF
jgi:hypothetical protein